MPVLDCGCVVAANGESSMRCDAVSKPCQLVRFRDGLRTTTGHAPDPEGVNHPKHYNVHPAGIECIDVVRHMGFNIGSAVKYLWRGGLKPGEATVKDYKKAIWYIEDEIKKMEKEGKK